MIRKDLSITMSDGCRLASTLFLPGEGRHPLLVALTPYGRHNLESLAQALVPAGYALLLQDVRGRFDSEGSFQPFIQEKKDAPAISAWLYRQKWLDTEKGIGILGFSYLAVSGLFLATECKLVKTMVNMGGMLDVYETVRRGGALNLHHILPWTIMTGYTSHQPNIGELDWQTIYATRPLAAAAEKAGYPNQLWPMMTRNETKNSFWEAFNLLPAIDPVNMPILHFSGWYDICLGQTLALFNYFAGKEKPTRQELILGPWSHNGIIASPTSLLGVDFGEESASNFIQKSIAWFNHWLKGESNLPKDQINIFVTGKNKWLKRSSWPLPDTKKTNLYLGDGYQLYNRPQTTGKHQFKVDPHYPVPSIGGSLWEFPSAGLNPGPALQNEISGRDDVVAFATPALVRDLTVAGPLEFTLFGALSEETGDWVVRLVDINPAGERRWVADGTTRAHFRKGPQKVVPVTPGSIEEYTIDLWAVGHTFAAGHKLGIEISGSSFPKWDINDHSLSGAIKPSMHTLFWGQAYPSRLSIHQLCTEQ